MSYYCNNLKISGSVQNHLYQHSRHPNSQKADEHHTDRFMVWFSVDQDYRRVGGTNSRRT